MKNSIKLTIVAVLAAAVAGTFALRDAKRDGEAAATARRAADVPATRPPAALPPPGIASPTSPRKPPPAAPAVQVSVAPVRRPALPPPAPAPVAEQQGGRDLAAASPIPAAPPAREIAAPSPRPRLLELGSSRCMACQQMAKVLDQLRASQGDRLQVDFIDVFETPEAADPYEISLIPTQILFDASGREIYRHTGFFSHDDILGKFRELGAGP